MSRKVSRLLTPWLVVKLSDVVHLNKLFNKCFCYYTAALLCQRVKADVNWHLHNVQTSLLFGASAKSFKKMK